MVVSFGIIRSESEDTMSNYITIGGGWIAISGTGEQFIRIKFKSDVPGNSTFNMWKNKDKKTERHPDYLIKAAVSIDETTEDSIS
jgi:uncharacterized protein (DUF736 family)